MSLRYLLPAFTVALAFTAPVLSEENLPTKASAERGCEVRVDDVAGGKRLQAVAFATFPASGEYDLVVSKSGGGGTSNTSQGGEFEVGAGTEATLSEVTLGGGGSFTAELTVSWSGGTSCRASYPRRA
jgi:hypothetical protein